VVAVDTNLLVYAHRTDASFHEAARSLIESLAQGTAAWAIPWPCAHEFVAIVTNARIFKTPTPLDRAFGQLRDLAACPALAFLAEGEGYLERLEQTALAAQARGGAVHDARIAAICLHHGVTELWSADRDFSRFPALRTRNPLAG
jgi:hypothetical protein